jgi:predicted ATPase/DNA-binding SARP family transcriptional activator
VPVNLEVIVDVMPAMSLRVLGSVEVLGADAEPVKLGELQRVLLASLLARAGSVVAIDQLVQLVWPDRPPADPEAGLHSQVSRLRRALTAAGRDGQVQILTRPPGYLLSVTAGQIDAQRFDTLAAAARRSPPKEAVGLLDEALGLWRGRAYGEFADVDVARFEAIRLEQARLGAFEAWTAALLECGRVGEALPALEAFVAEHPLREESRLVLMRALCAVGRHADALAGYRRYRDELADELGLDPSAAMQQLELQILRREIPGPPGEPGPLDPGRAAEPGRVAPPDAPAGPRVRPTRLPTPLTTFIGRAAERKALAATLAQHRLVTAVGPGGVGKTRLALAVGADVIDRFDAGVWYVDLVPVTDPAMIAPAVAAALGLTEQPGHSAAGTVLQWLSDKSGLIILDNCERLLSGVVALVEQLLAGCDRLVVLATSRARLQVPFEWVFQVPGLSVSAEDDADSDAVALFQVRAASAGSRPEAGDRPRITALCAALDGMALAIELAAARLPAVGLDGLELGLTERLRMLTGGSPADDRHRSLRSTLDWSYALLSDLDRAVLRRVSVFTAPFTVEAAGNVIGGWPPVSDAGDVSTALAELADQSLLTAVAGPGGTRYRALETVRQYGAELLVTAGERTDASVRHLRWCLRVGAELAADPGPDLVAWRSALDLVIDDLRSALTWSVVRASHRSEAHQLAITIAELTFVRGLPGESQRRYEQAAQYAQDDAEAAWALRQAAAAALSRHVGNDAVRLFRMAAAAGLRCDDRAGAVRDLAKAAEMVNRGPGLMATPAPAGLVAELLAEARRLDVEDLAAQAQLLTAEAFDVPGLDPRCADLTERALELARRAGDPLIESAALDQLTSIQLVHGDIRAAAASSLLRTRLLAPLPMRAELGLEVSDAYNMAAECAIATGDLAGARRLAEASRDLPFHHEEGHLATSRLILVTLLTGDWDAAVALAERFKDGWERAGRPRAGNHAVSAYAAATLYGLRGDEDSRATWLDLATALETPGRGLSVQHSPGFFDALLLLHHGRAEQAVARLQTPPEEFQTWYDGRWRPWYAALWVESAVLSAHPDATERLHRARPLTADNRIAAAIVDRARALADGDRAHLLAAAEALNTAGCRYQWARTLVLAGAGEQIEGRAALAAMGAAPMPG